MNSPSATLSVLLAEEGLAVGEDTDAGELDAASAREYLFDPQHAISLLAQSLSRLHSLELRSETASGAPALTMADVISDARATTERAPEAPLGDAYAHMTRTELLEVLEAGARRLGEPGPDDLVVTHGSPELDTLMCRGGEAVGFVGWEAIAVADRHRDLAHAASSLVGPVGPMAVPELFVHYGRDPEPARLDWWLLAAQLTAPVRRSGGGRPR